MHDILLGAFIAAVASAALLTKSWWLLWGLVAGAGFLVVRDVAELLRRQERLPFDPSAIDPELRPSWLLYPDVERAQFLNLLLQSAWPYIRAAHEPQLRKLLNDALEGARPHAMLTSLEVSQFSLGDVPPEIMGCKAYRPNDREYVLDAQLRLQSSIGLEVAATTRLIPAHLHAKLDNVVIQGTLRIELRPLLPKPPYAGTLHLSLLHLPIVDFDVHAVGFNLMAVPGMLGCFCAGLLPAFDPPRSRRMCQRAGTLLAHVIPLTCHCRR
jgi:hypothetical protein